MALTTTTINIDIKDVVSAGFTSARVKFALTGPDQDSADDIAIASVPPSYVTLDDTGVGTVALWPNDRGATGSSYDVTALILDPVTKREVECYLGRVAVPSSVDAVALEDLLSLPAATPIGETILQQMLAARDQVVEIAENLGTLAEISEIAAGVRADREAAEAAALTLGATAYATAADLPASPAPGARGYVYADGTASNNGLWFWNGSAWVRDALNPVVQSELPVRVVSAIASWSTEIAAQHRVAGMLITDRATGYLYRLNATLDAVVVGDARTDGIGQDPLRSSPATLAGNAQLMGYDAQGRAMFVMSPFAAKSLLRLEPFSALTGDLREGVIVAMGDASVIEVNARGETIARLNPASARAVFAQAGVDVTELAGGVAGVVVAAGDAAPLRVTAQGQIDGIWTERALRASLARVGMRPEAAPGNLLSTTALTVWGDSLTGFNWAQYIAKVVSGEYQYDKRGIGGQNLAQTIWRSGAIPMTISVAGGSVPAKGGGSVAVTAKSINALVAAGVYSGNANIEMLGHVFNVVSDSAGNWTISSLTATAAVTVPDDTLAYASDAGTGYIRGDFAQARAGMNILWAGTNDGTTLSTRALVLEALERVAAWVKIQTSVNKKFIVMTAFTGAGEDQNDLANRVGFNRELKRIYGDNCIDVQGYMAGPAIYDALALGYITEITSGDLEDIAAYKVPRSLRIDTVHLTEPGYMLVARLVDQLMTMKGW